jgi:hypothetical protein
MYIYIPIIAQWCIQTIFIIFIFVINLSTYNSIVNCLLKVGGYIGRNKGEDYEEVENICNA